ncbi:hypothetical protein [Candidatus Deferrimicrobium sp.]|uniref:hypothetical protein n=1 Tax=Candidatus Deferrimicrobium sp. TaxID=3060586 RepID=UPI002ED7BDD5
MENTGRGSGGIPEAIGGFADEYSPAVEEYSSTNTYRGNYSAENTFHSSVLCRKRKWHVICFSIDATEATGGNQQLNFHRRRRAMKKLMAVMAVFVMASGMSVVAIASDVSVSQQSLEAENYAGHVDSGQISGPIETGALPAKSEGSKMKASDSDASRRSLELENYAGHPDTL